MTKNYSFISMIRPKFCHIHHLSVLFVLFIGICIAPLTVNAQNFQENLSPNDIQSDLNPKLSSTNFNYPALNKKYKVTHNYSYKNTTINIDAIISGIVVDSNTGEPVPYVRVWIEGTSIVTQSSINGSFSITIPENLESGTLSFRLVG
jgi:hypothetical protein